MNDLDIQPEDNPMLFRCTLPSVGRVQFDFQIVACEVALGHRGEGQPDPALIVAAMRKHATPMDPEKAPTAIEQAHAAELLMAFSRAGQVVEQAGKHGGSRPGSQPAMAADPRSSHQRNGSA